MKKPIYLLSHKLKWKAFKELQKLVKDSGPVPVGGDKVLWKLMRKELIYCWFSDDLPNDIHISLELPKGREIKVIKNYDKPNI